MKLKKIWSDMGYIGKTFHERIKKLGLELEIIKTPRKWFRIPEEVTDIDAYLKESGIPIINGFQVLPRRWVVERTFAWFGRYRRLSKDYEYLCNTSDSILFAIMVKILLKRIVKVSYEFQDTL